MQETNNDKMVPAPEVGADGAFMGKVIPIPLSPNPSSPTPSFNAEIPHYCTPATTFTTNK